MTRGYDLPGPNHSAMAKSPCRRRLGDERRPISRIGEERPEFADFSPIEHVAQCSDFAGISRSFESLHRTTENRGVPGSSPGLAIRNPAFQRDFLLFGWSGSSV